jgi:hypothetical protein
LIALETLREITRNAAETHRCLLNLSSPYGQSEAATQLQKLTLSRQINDLNLAKLKALQTASRRDNSIGQLSESRGIYLKSVDEFLAKRESLTTQQLDSIRVGQLRSAYDNYLVAQDLLSDEILKDIRTRTSVLHKELSTSHLLNLSVSLGPILPIVLLGLIPVALLMWLGWMLPKDVD